MGIQGLELEHLSDVAIRAHAYYVEQTFRPRTRSHGNRVFDLERRAGSWVVVSMGPEGSARSAATGGSSRRRTDRRKARGRGDAPPKAGERGTPARRPAGPELEAEFRRLCVRYYNTQGEWAERYRLAAVRRTHVEWVNKNEARVHIQYRSRSLRGRGGAEDARVFHLWFDGDTWRVTRMDGQFSARFPR